jgi:hypothetical protein
VHTPRLAPLLCLGACALFGLLDRAEGQPRREAFTPRPADAPLYRRIAQVRKVAEAVKIDGQEGDWEGIPEFGDPPNDSLGEAARDIVRAAIAPREEELLVLIETAQRPTTEDQAYWLNIDLMGFQADDLQIGLAANGEHTLWILEEGQPNVQKTIRGIDVAIRDVVEVRIPYKVLAAALPPAMAVQLTGERARPAVRVTPFTWDKRTKRFTDYGPAVACFRLLPTPFPLDPPPPQGIKAVRAIDLPVAGKWYVGQGAFSLPTHREIFAYDFYIVDHTGHPSTVRDSKRGEDYLSWNQTVTAPLAGRVLRSKRDAADNPPRALDLTKPAEPLNEVLLDIGDGLGLRFAHFRRQSVAVGQGQNVTPGRTLGNVGNSGKSPWPHLELSLWKLPDVKISLPMALANVRVSLNYAGEDPWAREFPAWDIREGYFVERMRR